MMLRNPCLSKLSFFIQSHQQPRLLNSRLIQTSARIMSSPISEDNFISMRGDGLLKILESNPKRLKRIKFLGGIFAKSGFEVRIAGGAVRDILTGKEPSDIDLATTALPEQSIKILEEHEDLLRIITTQSGLNHGTVAVKFKEAEFDLKRIKLSHGDKVESNREVATPTYDDESPYEITTLRCDTTTDGRHAVVKFINDWKTDAERRDLTINAMFLTLDKGQLVDYFGGESDLKDGIVRFVGDANLRIQEDYLRILRFFRFWSKYGINNLPDESTFATIKQNLGGLDQISGERIWVEIKKTFQRPSIPVMKLYLELNLLKQVGVCDNQQDHSSYVDTVLKELTSVEDHISKLEDDSLFPIVRFATTIQSIDMLMNAHKRLKFSNVERDSIMYILDNRSRSLTLKDFQYELAMGSGNPSQTRMHTLRKMQALLIYRGMFDLFKDLNSWKVPEFPLTGGEVSAEFMRRKLPRNKIKVVFEELKKTWASSEYELSKKDLFDKMYIELESLASDQKNHDDVKK